MVKQFLRTPNGLPPRAHGLPPRAPWLTSQSSGALCLTRWQESQLQPVASRGMGE